MVPVFIFYILFFKKLYFLENSIIKFFLKKKFFIFSYFTHYDKERFNNKNFYPKQWSSLWENIIDNSNFSNFFTK